MNPSPLQDALEQASAAKVRKLCERVGFPLAQLGRIGRLGPHTAPWLKHEIAQTLGRPIGELFPDAGDE